MLRIKTPEGLEILLKVTIKGIGEEGAEKAGKEAVSETAEKATKDVIEGRGKSGTLEGPSNKHISELGIGNQTGTVNKNKLSKAEFAQAEEVVNLKGGHFEGQLTSNTPGSYLNGTPVSLKEYTGNSVSGVLKHVSKSETQVANAGLSNVDIYVNAKNISKEELIDFAGNGPLVDIPNPGYIKNIYVQTADGWVLIN